MKKTLNLVIPCVIFILSMFFVNAQPYSDTGDDNLSLDSSIRYGELANGLRYYIKSVDAPTTKTYLRLYAKAGSEREDPDQLEIAHAVEHLAFRASENLPLGITNESELLKEIGIDAIGRDFYGSAGSKVVEYVFNANPNNKKSLDTGLLWFRDIISGLRLDEKDIDAERGALKQELVFRSTSKTNVIFANFRLYAKLFPCKLDYNNYYEHIATFPPEILRRFYKDWYRPDLMAICVVGNIGNVDNLEKRIKEKFSKIAPTKNPRKSNNCDSIYLNSPPQFAVVERKGNSFYLEPKEKSEFQLFFRDLSVGKGISDYEGIKRKILWRLVIGIINDRFDDLTNKYNNYLQVLGIDSKKYTELPSVFLVKINPENGKEKDAFCKTIEIIHQFQKYGATKLEWEVEKTRQLQDLSFDPKDAQRYWVKEIQKHFVDEEPLPSNKQEYILQWLQSLSLEEFNDSVSELFSDIPLDIGIIAPPGHKMLTCTEKEVRSWVRNAFMFPTEPYTLPIVPSTLLSENKISKLQEKGYIDKGRQKSGATELILDNGARIVLIPNDSDSDIKESTIRLHGFSTKGAACFPKEDYFSAIGAPSIITNAGVGKLNKFEISRFLSDKGVRGVSPYVKLQESGIEANTKLSGLESMLQLIYLYFTHPRKDKNANEDWIKRIYNAYYDPTYNLAYTDFRNYNQEYLAGRPTTSGAGTRYFNGTKNMDFEKAYGIYQRLFANAQDFTFLIHGNFDKDSILPLIQKYLGNLPNTTELTQCNSQFLAQENLPRGPIVKKISLPEEYTRNNILYSIVFIKEARSNVNWEEQIKTEFLGALVWELAWSLRFEKGFSIYDIQSVGKYNKETLRYSVNIEVDCVPEEWKELQRECRKIFSEIKHGLIKEELFERVYRRLCLKYDSKKPVTSEQRFSKVFDFYRYNFPIEDPQEIESFVKALNLEDIIQFSMEFFTDDGQYEFTMGEIQ